MTNDFKSKQSSGARPPRLSPEEYAAKKKAEKEAIYQLLDNTALEVVQSPEKFKAYLDVQSRMDRYTANNALLGCFIPHHKCIDNVIHSRAGVQVRLDCSKIMGAQGEAEPAGCAKITLAYNLPSKYIIHTVGPMVGLSVTDEDRRVLRNCYVSSLNLAREMGLESIAFCCISTGIFGFPNDEAAAIAVGAVKSWLLENGGKMRVVFDVFLDKDREIYKDVLKNTK